MSGVRITFGIIVLNGLPFIKYNLESLYSFAHEIIVVEGACRAAMAMARTDGHSSDGTWEFLKEFAARRDPEHKLTIISAADEGLSDGFWPEKVEMSQAYARRATGNYLWQIDCDEFYMPDAIAHLIRLLGMRPDIKTVSFSFHNFWGGPGYVLDGYAFRTFDHMVNRVFAWDKGYRYVTHRPPTVANEKGENLKKLGWLSNRDTAAMGIHMFHYDMILPKQAAFKSSYYSQVTWHTLQSDRIRLWEDDVFQRLRHPFHVYTIYTHPSWLIRFSGEHPPVVERMLQDIRDGKWPGIALRRTDDIEQMLRSARFRMLLPFASVFTTLEVQLHHGRMLLRRFLMRTPLWGAVQRLRGRKPAVS